MNASLLTLVLFAFAGSRLMQSDERTATLVEPLPYQVIQRQGFLPQRAHEHDPGGPVLGHAQVRITGTFPETPNQTYQYRIVKLDGAVGQAKDWTTFVPARTTPNCSAVVEVPAGGWYRLEVRTLAPVGAACGRDSAGRPLASAAVGAAYGRDSGSHTFASASVEPIGVGEVFLVAGQSYAEGCNDERMKVEDPHGRIVAFDAVKKTWRVADDPQPNLRDGGTIWPCLGNHLLPVTRVPIGFVNMAVASTASRQWMPGQPLYDNLAAAGKAVGRFRAVLWQQGESDVIEKTLAATYVRNLITIRTSLAKEWGFEPPWLLAKSTLHPTVYNDPEGESRIRAAIDQLWRTPGFRPGPDTDILGAENRGGPQSLRHFSPVGQRRAALLWFAAVWHELNRQ